MRSEKMERVLSALKANDNPSTMELIQITGLPSPRDYVRRLREKGYRINTSEKWIKGSRVCRYRLIG